MTQKLGVQVGFRLQIYHFNIYTYFFLEAFICSLL